MIKSAALSFSVRVTTFRTAYLAAGLAVALFSSPVVAGSKDTHTYLLLDGGEGQQVDYRQGSMVATSVQPNSEVSIVFPQSADPGVAFVRVIVVNKGQNSINFGPKNVEVTGLRYTDYDKMSEAFAKIEASNRFWDGIQSLGNSLKAMEAGKRSGITSYSGQINSLSDGSSYNYSGIGIYQYYDANAASQARNLANLQNQAIAAQSSQSASDAAAILGRQLRMNTIYPGQAFSTEITIAGLKKGIKKLKNPSTFLVELVVGNEKHSFSGLFGPLGMPLE